jgi:serine/threonine protein kinase
MSPEQASGKADHTSDIWAFGNVLYEMVTGCPAFDGESSAEILSGIFKADPDWSRLPPATRESIRRLLRRCLQKERSQRLQAIGDARLEVDEAQNPPPDGRVSQAKMRRRERLTWAIVLAVVVFIGSLVSVITLFRPSANDANQIRFLVSLRRNRPSVCLTTEMA